jgi:hypothetical protein
MHVLICQSLDASRQKEQRQQRQGKSAAPVPSEG